MPKSIIEIDVQDAQFKAFVSAFGKYQDALKKMPEGWQKAGTATAKQTKDLKGATDELRKTKTVLKEIENAQTVIGRREREATIAERESARITKEREKSAMKIAGYVKDTTFQLAKWAAFGFLGAATGGIFGTGLLASSGNGLRRTSQGLGVAPGDLRAAESTYSRYLDVTGTLGNITNAQTDLSKRWILAGLGVSDQDAKAKSAAELLPGLLPALVNRYKQLGSNAQGATAAGLDQIIDIPTLRRLSSLNPKELDEAASTYGKRREQFAISDATLKKWQDFDAQLDAAKYKIENSFLVNLDKLAPALGNLSDKVAGAIDTFLKTKDVGKIMEEWATNVGKFADYVGSDSFQTSVKEFASDVGTIAHGLSVLANLIPSELAIANFFERIFGTPSNSVPTGTNATTPGGAAVGTRRFGVHDRHNPGNLRPFAASQDQAGGFRVFASDDAGIREMGRQLRIYQNRDHLDTVAGIIGKYAPAKDGNNVGAYINDVVKRTGFAADAHLNLNDPQILSKVIAAMTAHEGTGYKTTPGQVAQIIIQNETGGNATVIANQLAH